MDSPTEERVILIAADAGLAVRSARDIGDAIGACLDTGRPVGLLFTEADLGPSFFDLKTGLAGELMQKFVNYGIRLAVIVPDPAAHGQRFAELVHEHATHRQIRFSRSRDEALTWLAA